MALDYSPTSTYVWNAPNTPGVYHLEVDARDQTSVTSYDAAVTILYTVLGCTSASMNPSVASPQQPGASVTFTAASSGCATSQYKFFVQPPGGSWTEQTGYGGPTWTWNTSGLTPGTYGVGVWSRTVGASAPYEAYWLGTYTLTAAPCSAASLSATVPSPQAAGASIPFTASSCASAQFRFWLMPKGGSWTMQRDYGAASWTWNTAGLAPGTYQVGVWARQPGSANAYDAYGITTFALGTATCISAGLTPNLVPPQAPTATVTFTASSNGCTTPLYQFWLLPPGGSWTVKQGYSSSSTFTWNTTGYPGGTYQVGVWAKAASSSNSYDAFFISTYQLVTGACTAASITVTPSSPQAAGTSITLTATATGCSNATFAFWQLPPPGTTWQAMRGYSAVNTFTLNTGANGPYRFGVWVRQNGSTSTYEVYAILTYWVSG
jgi:hypothetical protein